MVADLSISSQLEERENERKRKREEEERRRQPPTSEPMASQPEGSLVDGQRVLDTAWDG